MGLKPPVFFLASRGFFWHAILLVLYSNYLRRPSMKRLKQTCLPFSSWGASTGFRHCEITPTNVCCYRTVWRTIYRQFIANIAELSAFCRRCPKRPSSLSLINYCDAVDLLQHTILFLSANTEAQICVTKKILPRSELRRSCEDCTVASGKRFPLYADLFRFMQIYSLLTLSVSFARADRFYSYL